MRKSLEVRGAVDRSLDGHAKPARIATAAELVAAGSVEVMIDGDDEGLADGSGLGPGLAQIASRLLDQLATGDDRPNDRTPLAGISQRDARGSRVPRDGTALVKWRRVVAISATGRLPGLVSPPVDDETHL
jgi:hypothetical protein